MIETKQLRYLCRKPYVRIDKRQLCKGSDKAHGGGNLSWRRERRRRWLTSPDTFGIPNFAYYLCWLLMTIDSFWSHVRMYTVVHTCCCSQSTYIVFLPCLIHYSSFLFVVVVIATLCCTFGNANDSLRARVASQLNFSRGKVQKLITLTP